MSAPSNTEAGALAHGRAMRDKSSCRRTPLTDQRSSDAPRNNRRTLTTSATRRPLVAAGQCPGWARAGRSGRWSRADSTPGSRPSTRRRCRRGPGSRRCPSGIWQNGAALAMGAERRSDLRQRHILGSRRRGSRPGGHAWACGVHAEQPFRTGFGARPDGLHDGRPIGPPRRSDPVAQS